MCVCGGPALHWCGQMLESGNTPIRSFGKNENKTYKSDNATVLQCQFATFCLSIAIAFIEPLPALFNLP